MNSQAYWSKREAEALKSRITDEKEYDKQLKRIYSDMLDACQTEINSFYGKYAGKEGITLAEAKKRVSELDIKAYERKAKRYVREKDFSAKANEEMRLYNATMKINRLEMLKANIGLELISGHEELDKFMEGILQGRTEDELKRQAGILGKTVKNNAQKANAIVNGSFHNATFSDRIWMYQDLMKSDLSKLLQSGLIQGKNPRVLARDLKKTFQTSTFNAERLMRTELARVQTEAQKQSFIRNGFDQYEFIVNGGCCPICEGLSGKHFKVDKMMPGENAPPVHPHCRCSTAAYSDRKEYEEWLDFLDKGGTTEEFNKQKAQPKAANLKQAITKAFTPAKSIKEAEEYAKSRGVKYALYNDLPLEMANTLNRALDTLPDDVRPVFVGSSNTLEKYWGGKLPRSNKHYYGVTVDTYDGIHLGLDADKSKYVVDFDTYGQMVGISSSYKSADKITAAKQVAQAKYQAKKDGHTWFYNVDGYATPFHEMGHVYENAKGLPAGFEQAAAKWAKETKCDMLQKPTEAWAEAWGAYYTNNPDLPDYISKYIREIEANSVKSSKKGLIFYDDDGIISLKKAEFKKNFESGKISTLISPQKQARHIKGTKQFNEYVSTLKENGSNNLPSYLREDLGIKDLRKIVVGKLKGDVRVNSDGSYEEFVMCDDVVGYYYSPSKGEYIPTRCVQVKYSLGKSQNIHIIPVKEKAVFGNEADT